MDVRSRFPSYGRPLRSGAHLFACLGLIGLLGASAALAQRGGGRRHPDGPPPEALAACEGLARGAACTVETPDGARSGTCRAPEGQPLACAPEGGPSPGHGPPPEAIESCRDTAVGDACVVETPHGTLEGTCEELAAGLACVPAGMRR